jgi:hypothetical protein
MSESTRKIPEPIIEPMTSAVELNRPRLCTIFCEPFFFGVAPERGMIFGVVTSMIFTRFRRNCL